jgi:hypothetical protein
MGNKITRIQKRVANRITVLLLKHDLYGFLKKEDEFQLEELKSAYQKIRK